MRLVSANSLFLRTGASVKAQTSKKQKQKTDGSVPRALVFPPSSPKSREHPRRGDAARPAGWTSAPRWSKAAACRGAAHLVHPGAAQACLPWETTVHPRASVLMTQREPPGQPLSRTSLPARVSEFQPDIASVEIMKRTQSPQQETI